MPKCLLVSSLILLLTPLGLPPQAAAFQFGQPGQRPSDSGNRYPGRTPPTFPSDSHPSSAQPPDTLAPPPTASSNEKVEREITKGISQERRLQRDDVRVSVNDTSVTLTGEVSNHEHRYVAIRIATDMAGDHQVVDNLRLRGER